VIWSCSAARGAAITADDASRSARVPVSISASPGVLPSFISDLTPISVFASGSASGRPVSASPITFDAS
jgi:hypothetical protein